MERDKRITALVFGDGVSDSVEYEQGTDPMSDDTDGDGLKDSFELLLYVNPNMADYQKYVKVWNTLPDEHEPNPLKKDIYVEVDWMKSGGTFDSAHKFKTEAKQKAINSFKNAPVNNPDGTNGIILHIDDGTDKWSRGTSIKHDEKTWDEEFYGPDSNGRLNEDSIIGNYFSDERAGIFHYCVFGHEDASENAGHYLYDYMWISDNVIYWSSPRYSHETKQASTFIHELGHNIDLEDTDDNENAMFSLSEAPWYSLNYYPLDYKDMWDDLDFTIIDRSL